ncbi:MAG: radical SAM protein [Elusimicrobia bacterium]|nr:radical SAM protein [Elusimicrobiota bacterium]
MDRVDLKLGFACNNRCHFCVQGDKRLRFPARSMAQIAANLSEGLQRGCRDLVLTGGEPTVHKTLLGTIRLAKKLGYRVIQVQSNGRMFFYEKFCGELIAAGATEFSPSIHGSTPKIHDALTQAPGSFAQTLGGIQTLKAMRQTVIVNTVITESNFKDLPNLARLLVSSGVDQFQFAFVHILGSAAKNRAWLVPRMRQIMPYVHAGLDIGLKAGVRCMTEAIPYCMMPGYEDCVAERIIPETTVYDAEQTTESYTAYRIGRGKSKGPRCRQCRYEPSCEGPWREYPQMYGWSEFKPVLK